jgi:hypothetical protein
VRDDLGRGGFTPREPVTRKAAMLLPLRSRRKIKVL